MQPCLVFIHIESSLCHMYNDIKLTIIIARFVVMWYPMPPIYCHHSFHEELQKFKYHFQWHIVLSRSCSAANTIYRLAEYCLKDPVGVNHWLLDLECAFVNIQIVCYDSSSLRPQKHRCPELTSDLYAGSYYVCVCGGGVLISGANISLLISLPLRICTFTKII